MFQKELQCTHIMDFLLLRIQSYCLKLNFLGLHKLIFWINFKEESWTSGLEGGVGKHASPPCATTETIKLFLKTSNNQNHQKIELYRSPTTKDLKKAH